jgi:hypothetical protein
MPCASVTFPDGTAAIVCTSGRRKRCACGARATRECDWKMPERRSGTCDTPLCANCSTVPAPEKDLCPTHAAAFRTWSERQNSRRTA